MTRPIKALVRPRFAEAAGLDTARPVLTEVRAGIRKRRRARTKGRRR